jgi:hypothetical protein
LNDAETTHVAREHRLTAMLLGVMSAAFLAVNLATASRSPTVWHDEVMFADPAVNLATGNGFTSTAWPCQRYDEPFAGNAPLHSLLLAGWLKLFGISPTAVRSFNYVLMVGVVALCCYGASAHGWIRRPGMILLLAALLYGGFAITFSYRSGRYDILGVLWCTALFAASSARNRAIRRLLYFAIGLLIPITGLQLILYAFAMGIVLLVLLRGRALELLIATGLGMMLSLGLWRLWLGHEGVYPQFIASIRTVGDNSLATRIRGIINGYKADPSTLLLLVAAVALLIAPWRSNRLRRDSPLLAGILLALLVPPIVGMSGQFPVYYAWMAFIPVCVGVLAALEAHWNVLPRWLAYGCTALALLATMGLPARLALTLREWRLRDYDPIRQFVANNVRKGDWVLSDFPEYYPAKRAAGRVFFPPYLRVIGPEEKQRINVIIAASPATVQQAIPILGGRWNAIALFSSDAVHLQSRAGSAKLYDCTIYRRTGD